MFSSRSRSRDVLYTLLLVGVGAACVGLVAVFFALAFYQATLSWQNGREAVLSDVGVLYLAASLASLLIGPCLWWRMVIKTDRLSVRRGVTIGILGGIIAHPLTWYLANLFAFLLGQKTIVGLSLVINPIQDLVGSLLLSLVSLLLVGWITVLVGGVAGGLIAWLQSRAHCSGRWRAALQSQ